MVERKNSTASRACGGKTVTLKKGRYYDYLTKALSGQNTKGAEGPAAGSEKKKMDSIHGEPAWGGVFLQGPVNVKRGGQKKTCQKSSRWDAGVPVRGDLVRLESCSV